MRFILNLCHFNYFKKITLALRVFLFLLCLILVNFQVQALVSLESVVLGDFSEKFSKDKDPLDYIFNREENLSGLETRKYRENLSLYRGFYEEGKNLLNQCKVPYELRYESIWHKSQVKRALGSTLQYVVLDLLTRAIPTYAKYFDYQATEYEKLTSGMVDSFCSQNLSIISKNTLKKNFIYHYKNDPNFRLPSIDGNPLFSENLSSLQSARTAMEHEFKMAMDLFRSACSWSGGSEDYGLMTPLLKHPSIFAFLIRQFEGQVLEWKSSNNSIYKNKTGKVLNVWCENLICRRVLPSHFKNVVNRMLGSENLSEDLKKLYCEEILSLDYDLKSTLDQSLLKLMKLRSFESENLLTSYMISLLTGVPDFILRAKNLNELEEVFRSSVDSNWSVWAKKQIEEVQRDVYYEEPLTLELARTRKNFDAFSNNIDMYFDVNMGEFDRSVVNTGKVKATFRFTLPTQLIKYIHREIIGIDPRDVVAKENFRKRIRAQLEDHIIDLKNSFLVVPWKGDLTSFIGDELIEQVALKEGSALNSMKDKNTRVNIHFYFGTFALKSIKHMYSVQKDQRLKP